MTSRSRKNEAHRSPPAMSAASTCDQRPRRPGWWSGREFRIPNIMNHIKTKDPPMEYHSDQPGRLDTNVAVQPKRCTQSHKPLRGPRKLRIFHSSRWCRTVMLTTSIALVLALTCCTAQVHQDRASPHLGSVGLVAENSIWNQTPHTNFSNDQHPKVFGGWSNTQASNRSLHGHLTGSSDADQSAATETEVLQFTQFKGLSGTDTQAPVPLGSSVTALGQALLSSSGKTLVEALTAQRNLEPAKSTLDDSPQSTQLVASTDTSLVPFVPAPTGNEVDLVAADSKKKKKMMKKKKKMEKKHKEWKKGKKHKKKKYESKKKKGGSMKKKKGKKMKKKWGMEKKGHKKKGNFKKKKWGHKKKMKKGHKKGKKGHKMLKDKGHKKKGFKKVYHKEEWGKKKKWHDIKREKKWNTKQKKWKKKWHQEKGKKYKGKHMKKYHKKNKHGKKYKKEKKSKYKKHKGEKFKKGHKKKKEEYSKKKEGGKKKKMKKEMKKMKKKKG